MGAGKLVISLDLKLFWGVQAHRRLSSCRDQILAARRAIPTLLDLFSDYRVRVTWPIVGFLFCRSKDELLDTLPARLPTYRDARQSPYAHIARIGEDEREDPVHFAPSLIEDIAARPGQEIACHTFSYYHCDRVDGDIEHFEADLKAAIDVARRRNIILRSLVFPGNHIQTDYLKICRRQGISAYRGRPPSWPYSTSTDSNGDPGFVTERLKRWVRAADSIIPLTGTRCVIDESPDANPPVNVPATRRFRPFAGRDRRWLTAMQRRRLFTELDRAAKHGGLFHLWGCVRDFSRGLTRMRDELARLLDRFETWRRLGRMKSVTMHEVVTNIAPDSADASRARRGA